MLVLGGYGFKATEIPESFRAVLSVGRTMYRPYRAEA